MTAAPRYPHLQTVRTSSSYLAADFGSARPAQRRRLVSHRFLVRVVTVVAVAPLAGEVATGVLRVLLGVVQ